MLPALVGLAFVLRLAAGLARGTDGAAGGYAFYGQIAASLLNGDGFCYAPGEGCAIRMPLYPAVVAPLLAADAVYPGLIVLQSVLGALQAWLTWRLGRALFDDRVALVAAAMAALNPYAIVHDTAFQDTVVFNTLVLLAAVLLLEGTRARSTRLVVAAGAALGLTLLTSGRIVLLLPCAVAWLALTGEDDVRARLRRAAALSCVLLIVAGGWTLRNWRVAGAPVLSTETGLSLWVANNPSTFRFLPGQSIDLNTPFAWAALGSDRQRALESATEAERDRMFTKLAIEHVAADPLRALGGALRKVAWAFSGQLSPARDRPRQWAFAAVFVPLHVLAAIGLWRARPWSGGHALSLLIFVSFAATTAIFWAHTSHASYLHPWLFVYAASAYAVAAWSTRRRGISMLSVLIL